MKKFFRIILFTVLCFAAVAFSFLAYAARVTAGVYFDESKLVSASFGTEYFDVTGEKIEFTGGKERENVELNDLPQFVKYAFVAVEDKRFYSHHGVDYRRIAGAAIKNLKRRSFSEGASTISQQLIKNTHLSNEKTIKRKLKEIKLTRQLERRYTKNEILEIYLNTIYFGEGAYGIQSAAKTYFGKRAENLSVGESAMLAAVIKAPATYSPFAHAEKAADRRNLVLKLMREQNYLTEHEYEEAVNSPLPTKGQTTATDNAAYMNCALREAEEILGNIPLGFYGTYDIYTYFDPRINSLLQAEISDASLPYDYCGLVTDNATRGIAAAASDAGFMKRCPASTVKPWLVYAPAIYENEITLATKILDEKTNFNGFYPCNNRDEYHGYVSVKEAISKSLNVPAVKVCNCIGIEKIKSYAEKMNVKAEGGLGIALGAIDGGMTLKEICDCYSVFSCGGKFCEGKFIKRIAAKNGKVVYEHTPAPVPVFDEATAYTLNDTLKDCAKSGTAKKLGNKNLNLYAKTGTNGNSKGNFDAYTVSFSPEYTLGIWLGNADNSPMPNTVSGGTYPAIISSEIWKTLGEIRKNTDFAKPFNVTEVTLDKKSYDDDHTLFSGDDGETFIFINGTEPKPVERQFTNKISNITQRCENGVYCLSFDIEGYDGAALYRKAGDKETEFGDFTGEKCKFTRPIRQNEEYIFLIYPYTVRNGKKEYADVIELPKIKYKEDKKIKPPTGEWWLDE